MRSVRYWAAITLVAAACAQAGEHRILATAGSTQQGDSATAISIGETSNVCVSVRVDQRVWPTPLLPNADQNFSTFFAGELARLYRDQGGAYHLPGREQIPRFLANPDGANPQCRAREQDIELTVRYLPRPDGRPFVVSYRIAQGAKVRADLVSRDIEEDWRSGRLPRIHNTEPLQIAVTNDMRARAAIFIQELTGGN